MSNEIIEIKIDDTKAYAVTFDAYGEDDEIHISGQSLTNIFRKLAGPQQDKLGDIKHELRQVYVAMSRAIEDGDQLKIGIVLGQTITKLDELINL